MIVYCSNLDQRTRQDVESIEKQFSGIEIGHNSNEWNGQAQLHKTNTK